MNSELHEKLAISAERYGITVNSFIVFVLGQWVDMNFEQQKIMADKVDELFSSEKDVLDNPKMMEMIKEILSEDENFKNNIAKKLQEGCRTIFLGGQIELVTKSKEVVKGVLMPYDDIKEMLEDVPVWNIIGNFEKDKGLFIYTGKVLSFIKQDEIQTLKSLRFF